MKRSQGIRVRRRGHPEVIIQAQDDPTNEAHIRATWPVVPTQRVWLAVVERAIEDASQGEPEAQAWIMGEGEVWRGGLLVSFAKVCEWVSLGARQAWSVSAVRKTLKRQWRHATGKVKLRREIVRRIKG